MSGGNRDSQESLQDRYRVLLDVGRTLSATVEPAELYRALHEQALRVLDLTAFCIVKCDDADEMATIVYQTTDHGPVRFRAADFPAMQVQAPRLTCDPLAVAFFIEHPAEPFKALLAPMLRDGRVEGLLCAVGADYAQDDLDLFAALADHASIALANVRLNQQLVALSLTDSLTGLPSRRHLELFLQKEFAAARRGRVLTVILFDLDNFNEYNEREGHTAGDEVLRAFASVLLGQTRAMNLAARFGNDEFIAILADTDRRGGFTHAARIARAVAIDPVLSQAGIRASAGIASYNPKLNEPDELILAAERDLQSRKGGRTDEIRA
jgi:diguanylate cyclase (GGDEF)-like protein